MEAPAAPAPIAVDAAELTTEKDTDNEEQKRLRVVFAAYFIQYPHKATDPLVLGDLLTQLARAGGITA